MIPVSLTRRRFLRAATGTAFVGRIGGRRAFAADGGTGGVVRVPASRPTIQAGVEAASEGDLVLVDPGIYEEAVAVETPAITIRGRDRNQVVLDGGFERRYGVDVEADGVAVENLTARHYAGTGIYWDGVEGFRGSYLTAYNDRAYGIYAARSRDGRFEHCYASGHADAGFYLGRNHPFETVVTDVIAEHNALGYSGTSAGGDLTIRDSLWRANGAGIVPHTLDEADPPQRDTRVVDNVVLGNDSTSVPFRSHTYPAYGTGIFVWGGNRNLVARNVVGGHEHFGIALAANVVAPSGNVVRGNLVRDSGVADVGLGLPADADNRFARNGAATTLPADLEDDGTDGDRRVSAIYERLESRAHAGDLPDNDWRYQPTPSPQPTMPDPDGPRRSAAKETSVADGDRE